MIYGDCVGSEIEIDFLPSFYTFPNPEVNVRILLVPTVEAYFDIFSHLFQILTFVYAEEGANFIQMQKIIVYSKKSS